MTWLASLEKPTMRGRTALIQMKMLARSPWPYIMILGNTAPWSVSALAIWVALLRFLMPFIVLVIEHSVQSFSFH